MLKMVLLMGKKSVSSGLINCLMFWFDCCELISWFPSTKINIKVKRCAGNISLFASISVKVVSISPSCTCTLSYPAWCSRLRGSFDAISIFFAYRKKERRPLHLHQFAITVLIQPANMLRKTLQCSFLFTLRICYVLCLIWSPSWNVCA